jgi:hypothetical protein
MGFRHANIVFKLCPGPQCGRDGNPTLWQRARMPPAQVDNLKQKIWIALHEDAGRSSSAVGRLLGCSHHSVAALRRELEETGRIGRFDFRGGRPGKEAQQTIPAQCPSMKKAPTRAPEAWASRAVPCGAAAEAHNSRNGESQGLCAGGRTSINPHSQAVVIVRPDFPGANIFGDRHLDVIALRFGRRFPNLVRAALAVCDRMDRSRYCEFTIYYIRA